MKPVRSAKSASAASNPSCRRPAAPGHVVGHRGKRTADVVVDLAGDGRAFLLDRVLQVLGHFGQSALRSLQCLGRLFAGATGFMHLDGAPHHARELGDVVLQQVIGKALAHGLDRTLDGGVRRHQQYRQLRLLATQLAEQLVAVHTGHVHITDHQAEGIVPHRLQRLFSRAHRPVGKAADFQGVPPRLSSSAVALDQSSE